MGNDPVSPQGPPPQGPPPQGADAAGFAWYVGVDWGTQRHAVAVSDAAGALVREVLVPHTSAGLTAFAAQLGGLIDGAWASVAVGLEVPRGALVELFLERGAAVFALNPKQLDRFRDRFSVAGAKDDALDARVLASSLRTDRPAYRRVAREAPLVLTLRELSRAEAVLAEEAVALTNRLRELVHRIAPQWLALSSNADEPWFWTLIESAVATPDLGRTLRRAKIERLLKGHRVRRIAADTVLTALHTPPLPLAPGTVEAVSAHVQLLLPRVRLVAEQRRACARALEAVLTELARTPSASEPPPGSAEPPPSTSEPPSGASPRPSDVAIVRSAAGAGTIVSATLVAEASPLLALRHYAALRAVSGVAPVRRQTGKQMRGTISMRYACNTRLRNACYHWAFSSIRLDAGARAYYAAIRARGHSHARALRSVADRWLRILIAMLRSGTLYDAARFQPAVTPDVGALAAAH